MFGRFREEDGRVDLKRGGLLPIVSGGRVLALRLGVPATATVIARNSSSDKPVSDKMMRFEGTAIVFDSEEEAMKACSQRGRACALQTVFNKQCAALARDRAFVGLATSADPRETQRKAIDECARNGGARCVLQVFFCSF